MTILIDKSPNNGPIDVDIEDYSFKPETDGAMEASNFTITMTITFESVTNCTINGIMNYGAEDIIINNTMVKK